MAQNRVIDLLFLGIARIINVGLLAEFCGFVAMLSVEGLITNTATAPLMQPVRFFY